MAKLALLSSTILVTITFLTVFAVAVDAQPLHAPQAGIGRRKFYFQLGGDVQKLQRLAQENKINELMKETEVSFVFNTRPKYRVREVTGIHEEIKSYIDFHHYKMHSLYFRAIGRHLPFFRGQVDSNKTSLTLEFGVQNIYSTEKTAAITAGWVFSGNKQEVVGSSGRYTAVQRRMFLEANYSAAPQADTLLARQTMIHVPALTFGAQFLHVSGSSMQNNTRDRTFIETGASIFLRTALLYPQGIARDLRADQYTSVTGGGVRLQLLLDIPGVQLGVPGVGTNIMLGGYAEAVSMYAFDVEQSPYFINTGGRAVNFEWGFIVNMPIYGANPRHFNIPKNIDIDYSPGTLR